MLWHKNKRPGVVAVLLEAEEDEKESSTPRAKATACCEHFRNYPTNSICPTDRGPLTHRRLVLYGVVLAFDINTQLDI